MRTIAIIDMGTNTFHLLIAVTGPGRYRIIHREHEAVKIGQAGINEGFINDSACQRAIAALKKFRTAIDEKEVDNIYAFGTSAFRNARNGAALAAEIETVTGIPVRIISGDAEAEYIFAGVKAALNPGEEVNLVMDIGAGSVEFILGNGQQVCWKQSFEIGGQRLLERFQKHDPIAAEEIRMLNSCFDQTLQPLVTAMQEFPPRTLAGSSGTFDTLSDIFCIRQKIARTSGQPETPLTIEGFYEIYEALIHKNRSERMQIEGMAEMRVDMIVVSCCLIRYVLEAHSFQNIRVSAFSLKEGVLATLAAKDTN